MKKSLILISAATFVLIVSLKLFSAHSENVSAAQKASQSAQLEPLVAGPGRVEPISEDIQIGSELSGKLKSVNVEEGDSIKRGGVLAVLEAGTNARCIKWRCIGRISCMRGRWTCFLGRHRARLYRPW